MCIVKYPYPNNTMLLKTLTEKDNSPPVILRANNDIEFCCANPKLSFLINAHIHKAIAGFGHPLQADAFHTSSMRDRSIARFSTQSFRERCTEARLGWWTPDVWASIIDIVGVSHHWTALNTHTRRDSPALEKIRIEVIVTTPLATNLPDSWHARSMGCGRAGTLLVGFGGKRVDGCGRSHIHKHILICYRRGTALTSRGWGSVSPIKRVPKLDAARVATGLLAKSIRRCCVHARFDRGVLCRCRIKRGRGLQ